MTIYTFDMNAFSDLHKDIYGFRPSINNHPFYSVSNAERQIMWDNMVELEHTIKMNKKREKESIKNFESMINDIIDIGADDRETAIRWILESYNYNNYDTHGYICRDLNIPYSYEKEFKNIMCKANIPYEEAGLK
jgi:hypothetical protein